MNIFTHTHYIDNTFFSQLLYTFLSLILSDFLTRCWSNVSGLDPAKPLYRMAGPEDRIDKTDAKFVDIIHTNAEILGLFGPLGDIDFYPNGGKTQTQCQREDLRTWYIT